MSDLSAELQRHAAEARAIEEDLTALRAEKLELLGKLAAMATKVRRIERAFALERERSRTILVQLVDAVGGTQQLLTQALDEQSPAAAGDGRARQTAREAVRAEFEDGAETSADIGRALRAIAGTGQGASPG